MSKLSKNLIVVVFLLSIPVISLVVSVLAPKAKEVSGSCVGAAYSPARVDERIVCSFQIIKPGIWELLLQYPLDHFSSAQDRRHLLGEWGSSAFDIEKPDRPYIHVKILKVGDKYTQQIFTRAFTPYGIHSSEKGKINSLLFSQNLEEGYYELQIDNLKNAPAFENLNTNLTIRRDFAK